MAYMIALCLILSPAFWSNDDLRFGIADHYPAAMQHAIERAQAAGCEVFEDYTAICE